MTFLPVEQLTALLQGNDMTCLPVKQRTVFRHLQVVGASSNAITRVPPNVSRLTGLRTLYLYNNALRALPSTITALTRLHT